MHGLRSRVGAGGEHPAPGHAGLVTSQQAAAPRSAASRPDDPERAGDVFEVDVFPAGDVWWVEVSRRETTRPVIAFYHPEEGEAGERASALEEELRSLTPDAFRRRYDIA